MLIPVTSVKLWVLPSVLGYANVPSAILIIWLWIPHNSGDYGIWWIREFQSLRYSHLGQVVLEAVVSKRFLTGSEDISLTQSHDNNDAFEGPDVVWRFRTEPGLWSRSTSGLEVSIGSWRLDDIHRSPDTDRRTTACASLSRARSGMNASLCCSSITCVLKQKCVSRFCVHACCKLIPRVCSDPCAALIVCVCELNQWENGKL